MNDALGDIRNATAAPISAGSPSLPSGAAVSNPVRISSISMAICSIGVLMKPGQTALTRIPWRAYSSAAVRVMPMTACLLAEYAT